MSWGQVSVAVQPSEEPVSVAEARLHLRVDSTDDDALIGRLITAAREACEAEARRAFVTRTYELRLPFFPNADGFELPMPPLVAVESIKYTKSDGTVGTVTATDYLCYVGVEPGLLVLKLTAQWPNVELMRGPSVVIRYTAGYGAANLVPAAYRQATLLVVGHLYENREAVVIGATANELPQAVRSLLSMDRVSWW